MIPSWKKLWFNEYRNGKEFMYREEKKKKHIKITIFLLKFKNLSCNQANGRQALKCVKKKEKKIWKKWKMSYRFISVFKNRI